MSRTGNSDELIERLNRAVESLAMRCVVADDDCSNGTSGSAIASDELLSSLATIRNCAAEAGCQNTTLQAAQLMELASNGASGSESKFRAGLTKLQEALERERGNQKPDRPEDLNFAQDPELIREFILESRDLLASVESNLLAIERDPSDAEPLNAAFRGFHTIKGLAGFLELPAIQESAHAVENILGSARSGRLSMSPEVVDVVLAGADYLRTAVDAVEAAASSGSRPAIAGNRALLDRIAGAAEPKIETKAAVDTPEVERGEAASLQAASAAESKTPKTPAAHSVKVDTGKLDHLVDMVGEMVIAQSMLQQDASIGTGENSQLSHTISQLGRITSDIQRTAMSMRMVPVGNQFQRMSRLVRDLARKSGKQVQFVTGGEETELDRNIVEELADPLMHMIRNSIDHGLETSAEREAAGKPAEGTVSLRAYHQAGLVVIEVSDDGRGLDRAKILAKARERGLIDGGEHLSDEEVFNFIFEPGFSTAARVTEVSGRGVGMDVVKKNITKLRGRVDVRSVPGKGSQFQLKLPLTLAIIEGLIVGVGAERYVIPVSSVGEMLKPASEALFTVSGRNEMVMVRDRLLPLIRLHRCFNVRPRSENPAECLLIVAETVGKRFCLMVDDLLGKQEIVIKGLGAALKQVGGVSGGAIMGDGRVALILDMEGLVGAPANV